MYLLANMAPRTQLALLVIAILQLLASFTNGDTVEWSTTPANSTDYRISSSAIEYITGGKTAVVGEFPWQVSMQKNSRHFCGGSIVSENHIICASHCTQGQDPSKIMVVAGAHNMKDKNETSQQRIMVMKTVENPRYNSRTINHDIAVVVLSSPLEFNERVQPITLPPAGHDPSGKCITSGWGNAHRLGLRPVIIPDTLQKLNMTVVPRGLCRIPYLFLVRAWLTTKMVCGGAGTLRGSCNGDSGGPLICYDLPDKKGEPYLAGVTSFGVQPCGQALFPSVFANVASMRGFIDKEMEKTKIQKDPESMKKKNETETGSTSTSTSTSITTTTKTTEIT